MSLYMSQAFISDAGQLVSVGRRLKPTHVERSVFGEGDGSDIQVHDTALGRVGALNCWEHFQPSVPTAPAFVDVEELATTD